MNTPACVLYCTTIKQLSQAQLAAFLPSHELICCRQQLLSRHYPPLARYTALVTCQLQHLLVVADECRAVAHRYDSGATGQQGLESSTEQDRQRQQGRRHGTARMATALPPGWVLCVHHMAGRLHGAASHPQPASEVA